MSMNETTIYAMLELDVLGTILSELRMARSTEKLRLREYVWDDQVMKLLDAAILNTEAVIRWSEVEAEWTRDMLETILSELQMARSTEKLRLREYGWGTLRMKRLDTAILAVATEIRFG